MHKQHTHAFCRLITAQDLNGMQNMPCDVCTKPSHDTKCKQPLLIIYFELEMLMQAVNQPMLARHVLSGASHEKVSLPLHIPVKALLDAGPNPTDWI